MDNQTGSGLREELEARRDGWLRYSRLWSRNYWLFGTTGLAASSLAAAQDVSKGWAPYFAILSSVCVGLIGFANPQRRAFRYIRAWRVLDAALLEHKRQMIGDRELIDALKRGEAIITEAEESEVK